MKRAKKSQVALKVPLPSTVQSRKKSVSDHIHHPNCPRLPVTKSTILLPTISRNKFHSLEKNTFTHQFGEQDMIATKEGNSQIVKRQKLLSLHTEIDRLEKEIQDNKMHGKTKSKDYEQQLKRYDQITNELTMVSNYLRDLQQNKQILTNRKYMLEEDYYSNIMNFQEKLAQKQYCDEVLQQYKRQYQNQSTLVLDNLTKQHQIAKSKSKILSIQSQIQALHHKLSEWKNQVNFDLEQKIIKNKIIQLRIDLMRIEQQANTYAETHKILKIRQILCLHIKDYINKNQLFITPQQLNQDGMQIFICKNNIYYQFEQAVLSYRGKNKEKYELKVVQKYFSTFKKICLQINNSKYHLNKNINKQYNTQIINLRQEIISAEELIKNNQTIIESIQHNIELLFANQSLPLIEYLQQLKGRYQLSEIKTQLKKLKQQQKTRITNIKALYNSSHNLSITNKVNHINFMNKFLQLQQSIKQQLSTIKIQEHLQKKLLSQKQHLQNYINLVVSKWNDLSSKQQSLKHLYQQLHTFNRQTRHPSKISLSSKTLITHALLPPKAAIISSTLKQTLKMRINGKYTHRKQRECSKENIHKNSNILLEKNTVIINQLGKTRKSSLSRVKSAKFKKVYESNQIQSRDSLTALLMSKFVN